MFKEQKGITLVALVITIIVLLILAGVSISLVVGQEGVLGKAQGAVSSTERATADQEIQLSIEEAQMAYMNDWTNDQSVKPMKYYSTLAYYTNNCTGAKGASKVKIKTDGTDEIYVIYESGSKVFYIANFKASKPASTYKLAASNAAAGSEEATLYSTLDTAQKAATEAPETGVVDTPTNPGGDTTNPGE